MSFANPFFLFGLIAAAVPLLLHILKSRNVRRLYFPSLLFLRLVHRQKSFRLKITQLLLLLIRMSLVILVTMIFAQPFFEYRALSSLNPRPKTVVVVLDNAGGMRAVSRLGPLEKRARDRVGRILEGYSKDDKALILVTSPTARAVYEGPVAEAPVTDLPEATWATADWRRALEMVKDHVARSPGSEQHLHLVTSFRKGTWDPKLVEELPAEARTVLHPMSLEAYENWSVRELWAQPPIATQGEKVRVQARVTSQSTLPSDGVEVELMVDGKSAGTRRLPAGATEETVQFALPTETPGVHQIELVLPKDTLPIDDRREAILEVLPHRRVMIVNGKKSLADAQDEAAYITRVFGSRDRPAPGFAPQEALRIEDLGDYWDGELMVIANLKTISKETGEKLSAWVRSGGVLAVFLGDQVDPGSWNPGFMEKLGKIKLGKLVSVRSRWNVASNLGPLAQIFDPSYFNGVSSEQYFLIEGAESHTAAEVPVTLEDGTPALMMLPHGRGTVGLVNASASSQTSNFPLFPIFPVVLSHLAQLSTSRPVPVQVVGQRVVFDLAGDEQDAVLTVQGPEGSLHSLQPERVETGFIAPFDATEVPGVYLYTKKTRGTSTSERFVVVPSQREFDLAAHSRKELGELFPGAEVSEEDAVTQGPTRRSGFNILDLLLVSTALLVLCEMLLVWYLERLILPDEEAP